MSDTACPRCGTVLGAKLAACPRCLLEGELEPIVLGGALELRDEIGRGGMGAVFRARHLRLGRTVAVKLLPEELAKEPDLRARFEREARVLAMLSHPHIVTVHDFGQDGDQPYIVMELVEGKPLSKLIPTTPARAVEIGLEVADALAYAHARGVVHRDVKPQNILIDRDGRAKVTDFGIARIVGKDARGWTVTAPNEAVGTIGYLAPEVLQGAPPDPRMDVYSLGVVLYELAMGRLPAGAFDPPPPPLDRVVLRALAQDPAKRYADAGEMRRDLATLGEDRAALAAQPTSPLPIDRASATLDDEERNWLRAAALLLCMVTGVVLWAFYESVKPKEVLGREPLVMLKVERFGDRTYSRARFEILPALAAIGAVAVGMAGYGALRAHWRRARLLVDRADQPVADAACVARLGVLAIAVYTTRKTLEAFGVTTWAMDYVPHVGGAIEIAALFFVWMTVLEAGRTRRPLAREPKLWLGVALALVPPAVDGFLYLRDWKPG